MAMHRGRYFGSYDGGWIFLSVVNRPRAPREHYLVNLIRVGIEGQMRRFSFVAATLSSQPYEEGCVVAGIVKLHPAPGRQYVAFWRMSTGVNVAYHDGESVAWQVEDVVHYNGAFHFLTQGEHIVVGNTNFHGEPQVEWEYEYRGFRPAGRSYEQYVEARYLVESWCCPNPGEPTSAFKVFQMEEPEVPNATFIWRELPSLDGRMLFVGLDCSRSYDADQYAGLESAIYFLDDRVIRNPSTVNNLGVGAPLYRCSDHGRWTGTPPRVERYFPEQNPSDYSPQVWVIH